MEKNTLIRLIQKAEAGDKGAVSVLYGEYYKEVYSHCFSILQNEEEARDVVQETFLTAFENLNTLHNAMSFESWLKTIAGNKCKNYLKKSKPVLFSQYEGADDAEFMAENTKVQDPAEISDIAEINMILYEIVDRLPDEQRTTVMLYYYDGKSIAEISEIMECSTGTVKSRLNYARRKIREEIEAIEKRDNIRLHSAAIPFLVSVMAEDAAIKTAAPAAFANASNTAAQGAPVADTLSAAQSAPEFTNGSSASVKKSVLKRIFKTTASKVVAGILSAAVLLTGGATVTNKLINGTNNNVSTAGNTPGNLNNNGYVAMKDDLIYYSFYNSRVATRDDFPSGTYIMNADGSDSRFVTDIVMREINIVDDRIYFYDSTGIWSGSIDGGELNCIIDTGWVHYMVVVGDKIYVSNTLGTCVVDVDGSNAEILSNFKSNSLNVVGDRIYYVNESDDDKIYVMKTDGSDNHKIGEQRVREMIVHEDRIYYINRADDSTIYSMKLDGEDNRKLSYISAYDINISGDRIYCVSYGSRTGGPIYSMNLDGSDLKQLSDDREDTIRMDPQLNVVGNWIFYKYDGTYYAMRTDGSDKHPVSAADPNYELPALATKPATEPTTEPAAEPPTAEPIEETDSEEFVPYTIRVTNPALAIYDEPSYDSNVVGKITDRGSYTIVEEWDSWGRLESGAGWINLHDAWTEPNP